MKKFIYVLLPLQVLLLILSPRFGWKMHNPEAIVLSYKGTTYEDGKFHSLYQNENEKIDICYESIFSRQLSVSVNDIDEFEMKVEIDGGMIDIPEDSLFFIDADLIWNDSCGIFWWRYILTIAMTVLSIVLVRRANRIQAASCVLYAVSLLISLRIIF